MPQRIQLKRTRGWHMPPNTRSVARPSKYGNPVRIIYDNGQWLVVYRGFCRGAYLNRTTAARQAVVVYRSEVLTQELRRRARYELRGWNLACHCRLTDPCHADVLLEVANSTEARP